MSRIPVRLMMAKSPGDIPKGPHWAIITFRTVHIPGDERSRTSPGHGYSAAYEAYAQYEVFTHEGEWRERVQALVARDGDATKFVAIAATRAIIRTTVDVVID